MMLWQRFTEQAALRNFWLNTKEYEKAVMNFVTCAAGKAAEVKASVSFYLGEGFLFLGLI